MNVSNSFKDTENCQLYQIFKMINGHSNQNLTSAPKPFM